MHPLGLDTPVVQLMDDFPDLFGSPPWHVNLNDRPLGFACAPGWLQLLKGLFANLRLADVEDALSELRIGEVKEKYGMLRVGVQGGNERVWHLLRLAEAASGRTCEGCGAPSEVVDRGGWLTTLCPLCLKAPEVAERWRENPLGAGEGISPTPALVAAATVGELWQRLGALRPDLPLAVEEPYQGRHWPTRGVEIVRVATDPRRFGGTVSPHSGPGFDGRRVALIRLGRVDL